MEDQGVGALPSASDTQRLQDELQTQNDDTTLPGNWSAASFGQFGDGRLAPSLATPIPLGRRIGELLPGFCWAGVGLVED